MAGCLRVRPASCADSRSRGAADAGRRQPCCAAPAWGLPAAASPASLSSHSDARARPLCGRGAPGGATRSAPSFQSPSSPSPPRASRAPRAELGREPARDPLAPPPDGGVALSPPARLAAGGSARMLALGEGEADTRLRLTGVV